MAKLTRAQRKAAEGALASLDRAVEYLMSDRVAVCLRRGAATTVLDFTRNPVPEACQTETDRRLGHYALTEVAKDIGSELCLFRDAQRHLRSLLID